MELNVQEHYDKWAQDVRDPAEDNGEGVRRIDVDGAYAQYEIAPLPDGRWAMRSNTAYKCGNCHGAEMPWSAFESREKCVEAFANHARRHFEVEQHGCVTDNQRAAQKVMLEQLGGGLFGFVEPEVSTEATARDREIRAIKTLDELPEGQAAANLARVHHRRGDANFASQQWQRAIDDYTRVMAAKTRNTRVAELFANRGKAHSAMGQTDQAIADLERSLELQPTKDTAELLADLLLAKAEKATTGTVLATKLADPWAKLAAAYQLTGDENALDELVKQHPQVAVVRGDLYASEQQWEKAIATYGKLITAETTDTALLTKRAAAYVATEQWDLAKADWLRAIEQQPEQLQPAFDSFRKAEQWSTAAEFLKQKPDAEAWRWLPIVVEIALTGDEVAYAEFCGRMTQRFADSEILIAADCTVKASLLLPNVIAVSERSADTLGRLLADGSAPARRRAWAWGTRALLAYRRGDAKLAVEYVQESEELEPIEFAHTLNLAILALAQHQLQHPDEARKALEEASQLVTRLKKDPKKRVDHDVLIAEILYREAKALINGKVEPKPPGGDAKPSPKEPGKSPPADKPGENSRKPAP